MKTRHLEEDQWLNRKEWCLGSGRRRQLSQDRKDRSFNLLSIYLLLFCLVYFGASAHVGNGIELIHEVDAPIYCHPKDDNSLE